MAAMLEYLEKNITLLASILASSGILFLLTKKWIKKIYTGAMRLFDAIPVLENIAKEFQPNGGSSLRDAINRIESTGLAAIERDWVNYELDSRGIFEVDEKGQKCRVNKAWCNMTGISQEDAINGYGWINGIAYADRDSVRREWESAIRENRTSEMEYNTATGIRVVAVATVLRNKNTGASLGWLGTLTPIN